MNVLDEGHRYSIKHFQNPSDEQIIQFYKDGEINDLEVSGILCQDLLRVLINRVIFLDGQLPSHHNDKILEYLRKALATFEFRAIERDIEKEGKPVEDIPLNRLKGHWDV